MTVRVKPIATDADAAAVGRFLHTHLNSRVSATAWTAALAAPWAVQAENRGFYLHDDAPERADEDGIVGVYLAWYSERLIDDKPERFCNLGAWCVRPEYRLYSLRLLKTMLGQEGYHFTDLSPSGNVIGLNERLGFEHLDTTSVLMPTVPWPTLPGRPRITENRAAIEAALSGRQLQLYRDHARTAASRHVLLTHGDESCWVIFRKDRRKKIPGFASILHASDPDFLRTHARAFARHLLLRHGVLAILAEIRTVGGPLPASVRLGRSRPKMFRSTSLRPEQVDNLYSELVCVAW